MEVAVAVDLDPLVDTLTGWTIGEEDDPLLAMFEVVSRAMDERGEALADLKKKSDPPPEPPKRAA